jgi:hypothetical protein
MILDLNDVTINHRLGESENRPSIDPGVPGNHPIALAGLEHDSGKRFHNACKSMDPQIESFLTPRQPKFSPLLTHRAEASFIAFPDAFAFLRSSEPTTQPTRD